MFARSSVVQSFFVYAISNEKQLIEIKGDLLELVLSNSIISFFNNMPDKGANFWTKKIVCFLLLAEGKDSDVLFSKTTNKHKKFASTFSSGRDPNDLRAR